MALHPNIGVNLLTLFNQVRNAELGSAREVPIDRDLLKGFLEQVYEMEIERRTHKRVGERLTDIVEKALEK